MIYLLTFLTVSYVVIGSILFYKARQEKGKTAYRVYTYIQSAMFFTAALLFSALLMYLSTQL
ncbi:hypothetical protein [Larkinella rosea]|uniref:Uncharacterized protein n=1 Tax=Larkinella rosea TaxID=2025312 RepID=A0A3P1C0V5_9BACT|nr:hypothetical protein [Larkinella rosea]RRB06892.1 hypothetical protein EHT25_03640 [Larkinella rosea]